MHIHAQSIQGKVDPSKTSAMRRRARAEGRRRVLATVRKVREWLKQRANAGNVLTAHAEKSKERNDLEQILLMGLTDIGDFGGRGGQIAATLAPAATLKGATLMPFTLEPMGMMPQADSWLAAYTDETYRQGLRTAFEGVGGEAMLGMNADAWITQQMGRQATIDRALAVRKIGAEALHGAANRMVDRAAGVLARGTEGVGKVMAEMDIEVRGLTDVARIVETEIVRAKAEGVLEGLRGLGFTKVMASVEFQTAGDDRVCGECSDLEGEVMTIEQAIGVIPVHPSCRCGWMPVIGAEDAETVAPPPADAVAGSVAADEEFPMVEKMLSKAKSTGNEYSMLLDSSGKEVAGSLTEGTAEAVEIAKDARIYKEGSGLTHIHTHPLELPLSVDDYITYSGQPGVDTIVAITPSDKVYVARSLVEKRVLHDKVRDVAWDVKQGVIDLLGEGKITKAEASAMIKEKQIEITKRLQSEEIIEHKVFDSHKEYLASIKERVAESAGAEAGAAKTVDAVVPKAAKDLKDVKAVERICDIPDIKTAEQYRTAFLEQMEVFSQSDPVVVEYMEKNAQIRETYKRLDELRRVEEQAFRAKLGKGEAEKLAYARAEEARKAEAVKLGELQDSKYTKLMTKAKDKLSVKGRALLQEKDGAVKALGLMRGEAVKYKAPLTDVLGMIRVPSFKAGTVSAIGDLRLTEKALTAMQGDAGSYAMRTKEISLLPVKNVKELHGTVAHELGHHLAYTLEGGKATEKAFFNMRTAGEAEAPLLGYKNVTGKKDNFSTYSVYGGRTYSWGKEGEEILSVGIEHVYKDPLAAATKDPEWFNTVTGFLKGIPQ